jgi:iron complex outermembrane receptor protein
MRLLWTPTPRRTVWAAITRAVRTPSDIEDTLQNTALISASPVAYSVTRGNGTFTSETLLGYEAGFRSLLSKTISLDIAAFYNSYDHLQSLEPGTPLTEVIAGTPALVYPYFNGNGVKGTTSGIEIAPDWKPAAWWRLQASYSLLHTDLRLAPGSLDTVTVGSYEGTSPHHQARLQSFFDLSRNVELSLTLRYVGVLPFYAVRGYETGDARVAWRPVRHVEFAVVGQNLLQPHHAEYGGDPGLLVGIKRSVYASLTFKK